MTSEIAAADRIEIHEVIALHGHVVDDRDADRLGEVFAEDVVMDVDGFGYGTIRGLAAMREVVRTAVAAEHPLGHHVTNIVVLGPEGDGVRARSKGLAIGADGSAGTCIYEDVLRRGPQGWRIGYRKVVARKHPQ
ncbi:nuclear transport factor 2 family protein [Nocardia sp. BMG111209]|uniref:nuclear transport factor 2 family protein n=1 Tax=Nocardia sp. BMG111209 TaxID=1160137 RepID=UPI00036EFD35|nr:nuclear transport factor 2 family protein [Nocardia sp. BMG111209]